MPRSLIECLKHADHDMFPNIRELLLIGCTLPIGSSKTGRSFSDLRRIGTYLHCTMGEEHLGALTLMNIHHEEALKFDLDKGVEKFAELHLRKMFCKLLLFK